MRIIIICIISFISTKTFGQDSTLELKSPDKRFEIILGGEEIGDASVKFTSHLVDSVSKDTTKLAVNLRHDYPSPNWFWSKNSDYLLFEKSNWGQNSIIQIWNLKKKEIEIEIQGAIPIRRKYVNQFWDYENEILIYFDLGNPEKMIKPKLMSFNLKTKKEKKLKSFQDFFELDIPLIATNKTDRIIEINREKIKY